jgi:hypothetical protein
VALIGRIFVIMFALFLAALAAGIAAAFAIAGLTLNAAIGDPVDQILFWSIATFASGLAAFGAFLPTIIAVAIAEIFAIRSALIYAAAGAVILVIGYYSAGLATTYSESIDAAPPVIPRGAEIAAAVGVVFGLAYWAIAGRRAGAWLHTARAAN